MPGKHFGFGATLSLTRSKSWVEALRRVTVNHMLMGVAERAKALAELSEIPRSGRGKIKLDA